MYPVRLDTDEIALDVRIAFKNDKFIVICPFASRFPFETMILPLEHSSNFMDISDADIESLADIMSAAYSGRWRLLLDDPAFNYLISRRAAVRAEPAVLSLAHGDYSEDDRGGRI